MPIISRLLVIIITFSPFSFQLINYFHALHGIIGLPLLLIISSMFSVITVITGHYWLLATRCHAITSLLLYTTINTLLRHYWFHWPLWFATGCHHIINITAMKSSSYYCWRHYRWIGLLSLPLSLAIGCYWRHTVYCSRLLLLLSLWFHHSSSFHWFACHYHYAAISHHVINNFATSFATSVYAIPRRHRHSVILTLFTPSLTVTITE